MKSGKEKKKAKAKASGEESAGKSKDESDVNDMEKTDSVVRFVALMYPMGMIQLI